MRGGRLFAAAAAVTAAGWLLMALGGFVRVSESGLGCPDWPACHGQVVSDQNGHALIEQAHRWVAGSLSVAVVLLAIAVFRTRRGDRRVTRPALAAVAMIALQVVLGGVTVLLNNVSWTVVVHYGAAAALVATLALLAVRLGVPARPGIAHDGYTRAVTWLAGVTFVLLLAGATVATTDSHEACGTSIPLCNGTALPTIDHHVAIHLVHRFLAAGAFGFAVAVLVLTQRRRPGVRPLLVASRLVAGLFVVQGLAGALVVLVGENEPAEILHTALASLTWTSVAVLLWLSRSLPAPETAEQPTAGRQPTRQALADYLTLMKPRIMVLILITAFGAMAFAAGGLPPLGLSVATLVGLGLSSAGASSLNHYLDRDVDACMRRTAGRPLPAGRLAPRSALVFGLVLLVLSSVVLSLGANPLTALLALAGALIYVVVYTAWLKRRTPRNIVIGGAAGALPPLVGWAAVTGDVGLPALFMFAIIFYWTPPHFWALAILARSEYARARIPMLPVVRGEKETARRILLYTLVLVGVSLLPFAARTFGWVYLAAALALGAEFVLLAVRLVRETTPLAARRLFLYSLVYLALLFAAIGVDRAHLT